MGSRGPAPKREDQRRRRNKTDPATKVQATDETYGPELTGEHSDPAKRFYEALRVSPQGQFFQPSDWSYAAEIICPAIDAFVGKPSAMMLASLNSAMANLLVTEGDRRRVRLEIETAQDEEEAADVSEIDEYRRKLKSG